MIKDPGRATLATVTQQGDIAPATSNTKATTMIISRLIHTASVTAVYASRFGFPYTGKTRFRSGNSPYRMGFEPIRLLQRISNVALSPPFPTLQTLPGATMFDVQKRLYSAVQYSLILNILFLDLTTFTLGYPAPARFPFDKGPWEIL